MEHKYNLKRQVKDERDYSFKHILNVHPKVKLPLVADLTPLVPTYIFDQDNEGSCTANIGMYGPPQDCKRNPRLTFGSAPMYSAFGGVNGSWP